MKTMTMGELKRRFSEALAAVRAGGTIIVSDGLGHRNVAAMVPYSELKGLKVRPLGLLRSRGHVKFGSDFAIEDEQFLKS